MKETEILGIGRRFTGLVTVFALLLGIFGAIAATHVNSSAARGLDGFALLDADGICGGGSSVVAKVEMSGKNGAKGNVAGETITLATTTLGTVTIRVEWVNGKGEILGFTVLGASVEFGGVVSKFGNASITGTSSPNGNALSTFTLCAAVPPTATPVPPTATPVPPSGPIARQ